MDKLCEASNAITHIKSTDIATSKRVLDEADRFAHSLSTDTTTIFPAITS
jgi:hypothetical protein